MIKSMISTIRVTPDEKGPTPRARRAACRAVAFLAAMSLFLLTLAAPMASSSAPRLPAQTSDAAELVAKVGDRLASLPRPKAWHARVHSTTSYMTSDWKPKKTTTAEKIVTQEGRRRTEEILSAVETEDGKSRDVTKKVQAEAAENEEKQERQAAKDAKDGKESRGRRGMNMTEDQLLPFGPETRAGYDFTVKGTADLDGAPVILLQSRSRVRSDERLEGVYFVDAATYDVRRAELTLAKKPGPLKRMDMEFDFGFLPEGPMVMMKLFMRIHVGLIVKNIRIQVVESYSEHKIGPRNPGTGIVSPI